MAGQQLTEDRIFNVARRLTRRGGTARVSGAGLRRRLGASRRAFRRCLKLIRKKASWSRHRSKRPSPSTTPVTERPGAAIGRYKLREQIGEGGMGVVFVAEQEQPIRRKVALKIIKPGMDTKEVIARFEAERQALALMDHPNIAKVLDAGTTESGRPYFVMELVRGIPITEYCDQHEARDPRTARIVRPGVPGDPARPPEGDHPSGYQADQRARDAATTASPCPR